MKGEDETRQPGQLVYLALYNGKQLQIEAPTLHAARQKAARLFHARPALAVTVWLAETADGPPVVHIPVDRPGRKDGMKRTHLRHPASTAGRARCNIHLTAPLVTDDPAAVDCKRCRELLFVGHTGRMISRVDRKTTKRGS